MVAVLRAGHGFKTLRSFSSAVSFKSGDTAGFATLPTLPTGSLNDFREQCWVPEQPAVLPSPLIHPPEASQRWFTTRHSTSGATTLNWDYLSEHSDVVVPLELVRTNDVEQVRGSFQRFDAPLRVFLDWTRKQPPGSTDRLYLAQASLTNFPKVLRDDLPEPDIVRHAGRGDVYDANLWIGRPPTYTPLHRDPNPNLFLQLAGHKVVRLFPPPLGTDIFARVQKKLGRHGSPVFRGEEMMHGEERDLLEHEVWTSEPSRLSGEIDGCYEARLQQGDGLFIPKGWWHSVKGVGQGINASVNWWFR